MVKSVSIDQEIVAGIRAGDKQAINLLYDRTYPGLKAFVKRNRGTDEDAIDMFQECMYYLFRALKKSDDLQIDNVFAYFTRMYQNRWRLKLKKRLKEEQVVAELDSEVNEDDTRYYLYLRALQQLGEDCKNVLKLYVDGLSVNQIAERLSTTTDYAKRKKYLCKEQLKKIALKEKSCYEQHG